MSWDAQTLSLVGANNSVDLSSGLQVITSASSVTENSDGTIVLSGGIDPGGATLTGGTLSVQLGNGNVATMSGVSSGTQIEYVDASGNASWTTLTDTGLVVNQLISAMASYSPGLSAASTIGVVQAPTEYSLFASSHP